MPRTRVPRKINYGEPGRVTTRKKTTTHKRKNSDSKLIAPKKIRVGKSGEVPPVLENWEDEIIRERGEDHFWEEVRARQVDEHPFESVGYDWNRLCSEAPPHRRSGILGPSILKFRFERGEFPLSATKLGSNSQFVHGWDEWVTKVLKNPSYVKLLSSAGIFDAIRITSNLNIRREKRIDVWRTILARWSMFSHTMIIAWGEFTFTLEDVCVLLELPCIRKDDFYSIKLSEEEMCLWERFGTCAPMPNAYPFASFSVNNPLSINNYKAWAWHDRLQRGNVLEVMDVTKEFNPRPYVQPINGFGDPAIYYDLHPLQSGRMSSRVYSPYRVARQFGFDQPAPPDSSSPISFSSYVSPFLMTGLSLNSDKLKSCTIPAFDRVGIHTSGWFAYWGECIGEWRSFTVPLTNPTARLYTPHVSNNDISLRLIPLKKKKCMTEEEDTVVPAPIRQTKDKHAYRKVKLNSVEKEETSEVETEEESCDSERSDEFDDESIDVDKVEIEGRPTPFDDFIDLDVLFPNHVQSSTMNQIVLTPQAIRDEVVSDTKTIPAGEVVPKVTLNIKVIQDVRINTDDVRAIPMTPRVYSSSVPEHKDTSSASGTQIAYTEQSGKKVDFHDFQVSLEYATYLE
ncbi:Uncharacterized protein TCM_003330 [Theobroma cacao]|uniref:Aminotransferase-like plant mobile domain-containing protein n=1 Tax=Theobroma cacao TaxID=3641 RepID=A0A061DNX4_THECC|nr:Uncharacterized protein TCM_003330 [Theobroma cacao]